MVELGVIEAVDIRAIWPDEARDFTPWLAENLDKLGDAVGLDFELTERESCVGSFWCDLVASGIGSDKVIVIENQLEQANHGHLGQLITYAAGKEASVVIWVAREIRDEYKQALTWLNSRTDSKTDFFGVVVEALRIDRSNPAVNFKVVVSPNEWRKRAVDSLSTSYSPKNEQYREFFRLLLDELRDKQRFTNSKSPQPQGWMNFSSGIPEVVYGVNFSRGGRVRAELYIDSGDVEMNDAYFNILTAQKTSIQEAFGGLLEWEPLPTKRACRVATYRNGSIESPPQELSDIREWLVKELLKFKKVFGPLLEPTRKAAQEFVAQQRTLEDAIDLQPAS
jgi:hypothetical protein